MWMKGIPHPMGQIPTWRAGMITADPLVNGWDHCNPQIILNETESAKHVVKIVMHPGDEEKAFTILGFGVTL